MISGTEMVTSTQEAIRVLDILIATSNTDNEAKMLSSPQVSVEAGKGVFGDRYHSATGSYSDHTGSEERQVTLIAYAAFDFEENRRDSPGEGELQFFVTPEHLRRNFVLGGCSAEELVQLGESGATFRLGQEAIFRATGLTPVRCSIPQKWAKRRHAFVSQVDGGIRAVVLRSGLVAVKDQLEVGTWDGHTFTSS